MFCTKCGNELKEGAKFCTKCGTPIDGAKEVEAPVEVPIRATNEDIDPEFSNVAPKRAIDKPTAPRINPEPKREEPPKTAPAQTADKQKKSNSALIAVIIVLIVAVLAVAAFFLYQRFQKNTSDAVDNEESVDLAVEEADEAVTDDADASDDMADVATTEEVEEEAEEIVEKKEDTEIAEGRLEIINDRASTGSVRKLTNEDLSGLTPFELEAVKNGLYCMCGYYFDEYPWSTYFMSHADVFTWWYMPDGQFNSTNKENMQIYPLHYENVKFIESYEIENYGKIWRYE